uniref:Uncharacterized protein n=1 Tax=Rhizophora mucronata TaxID=61149 RepID=A0A2P2QNH4_RHIMU
MLDQRHGPLLHFHLSLLTWASETAFLVALDSGSNLSFLWKFNCQEGQNLETWFDLFFFLFLICVWGSSFFPFFLILFSASHMPFAALRLVVSSWFKSISISLNALYYTNLPSNSQIPISLNIPGNLTFWP